MGPIGIQTVGDRRSRASRLVPTRPLGEVLRASVALSDAILGYLETIVRAKQN